MLSNRDLDYGVIKGTVITFENTGDVLPWHTHAPNSAHISIVGCGSFRMEVKDPPMDRVINSGALVDTAAGVWHQFTALAPNSRLFQIIKEPGLGADTTSGAWAGVPVSQTGYGAGVPQMPAVGICPGQEPQHG